MRFFCTLFLATLFFTASAQEIITELKYNPALITASKHQRAKFRGVTDTIQLPFVDDFSNAKVYPYPDSKLWADKYVFVNTTYPINPVSIGVATFDGLNWNGMPHDTSGAMVAGDADTLTSQPIHLESLSPADSLYLSFYYEAQGYGDYPNVGDELMLLFKKNDGTWKEVWSSDGYDKPIPFSQQKFTLVMIPVKDAAYFHNAFQFRFHNIATLSGNNDHWHIDYVRLDKNRFLADTTLNDLTITNIPSSVLKNYQQMPWSQFKDFQSTELGANFTVRMKNNFNVAKNVAHDFKAVENFTSTNFPGPGVTAFNINPLSYDSVSYPTFTVTAVPPVDSASLSLKCYVSTTSDINVHNDTVTRIQNFFNYYSYDDGSAEKAYGLQGVGAKLAIKFSLNQPDTLRAVQIHFAHIDADESNKFFSVMLWKSVTPEVIIHQMDFKRPTYIDSLNGFYTYVLDTPQAISDEFYIGTMQTFADPLDIGLDRNTDSHQNMFYNVVGAWAASSINGSVMIRPVIGKQLPVLTGVTPVSVNSEFLIYPNPAENILKVKSENNISASYKISDYTGRILLQSDELREYIDVSTLTNGLYFLQIKEKHSGRVSTHKFIKL